MRTLYLQRALSKNWGYGLGARRFWQELQKHSEEWALGHCVFSDERAAAIDDPDVRRDVLSEGDVARLSPTLIVMEEGPFLAPDGTWRLDVQRIEELVKAGTCLLVTDVHLNEVHENGELYDRFSTLLGATIGRSGNRDNYPVDLRAGADTTMHLSPQKMWVAEWLRPVYEGIQEIAVSHALLLRVGAYWHSLASGHRNSTTLHGGSPTWWDSSDPCPFASVRQLGDGYVAFIAGRVSTDRLTEGSDNVGWLLNVAMFLQAKAADNRGVTIATRSFGGRHNVFLSHRSVDKEYVRGVASALRRQGIAIWFDERELTVADSLPGEISQGLNEMTHFVLFWSANCVRAPWVERELNAAISLLVEQGVPILVVRLDDTPVPTLIADLVRLEAEDLPSDLVAARLTEAIDRRSSRRPRA